MGWPPRTMILTLSAVVVGLLLRRAEAETATEREARKQRHNRRFRAAPSFAAHGLEWKADKPIGIENLNTSWVPSTRELMQQKLVRERRRVRRELQEFAAARKAALCPACGLKTALHGRSQKGDRSHCVGLGSLLVGFAQAHAHALETGQRSVYVSDHADFRRRGDVPCGWFTKDASRSCDRLFGCYLPKLSPSCDREQCREALEGNATARLRRSWGPTMRRRRAERGRTPRETPNALPGRHFAATLYATLHGTVGVDRPFPGPPTPRDCILVHVRRGDACQNKHRTCGDRSIADARATRQSGRL